MLDMFDEDACCGEALSEALRSGALDNTDHWVHEKCGTRWNAARVDAEPPLEVWVRKWTPEVWTEVFKP